MRQPEPAPGRRLEFDARTLPEYLVYVVVYVALGTVSLATAYVQANTATVWLPSGFAVALLIVRGLSLWPVVAAASFLLNAADNFLFGGTSSLAATGVAAAIALGNAGEAALGAAIARRYAGGADFFRKSFSFAVFAGAVALLAPLVSAGVGVTVSRIGGVAAHGPLIETALTWYVANAVGILVVTGPVAAALSGRATLRRPSTGVLVEAAALGVGVIFVGQAMCGLYVADAIRLWPREYMAIPLLVWASYRFGAPGAYAAIYGLTLISVIGTMRGYEVFPAAEPSRSLLYLQVFLAMMTVMSLSLAAAREETLDLQASLEGKVQARTRQVEQYARDRDMFTAMVAHDLQSPLSGMRYALRALGDSLQDATAAPEEFAGALAMIDETCERLVERVQSLLAQELAGVDGLGDFVSLFGLTQKLAQTHRAAMQEKQVTLETRVAPDLEVRAGARVEQILDVLFDNAVRHSPPGAGVEIAARALGRMLEICVRDRGPGLAPDRIDGLFRLRGPGDARGFGRGLYLASEQAKSLGGHLSYEPAEPNGACFRLMLPAWDV